MNPWLISTIHVLLGFTRVQSLARIGRSQHPTNVFSARAVTCLPSCCTWQGQRMTKDPKKRRTESLQHPSTITSLIWFCGTCKWLASPIPLLFGVSSFLSSRTCRANPWGVHNEHHPSCSCCDCQNCATKCAMMFQNSKIAGDNVKFGHLYKA